jgi:NDP-sugar pyrophosphorylase family protein
MFEKEITDYLPKRGDIERTTFPELAKKRKLNAYRHDGFWATVNTPKDLADVENLIGRVQTH